MFFDIRLNNLVKRTRILKTKIYEHIDSQNLHQSYDVVFNLVHINFHINRGLFDHLHTYFLEEICLGENVRQRWCNCDGLSTPGMTNLSLHISDNDDSWVFDDKDYFIYSNYRQGMTQT